VEYTLMRTVGGGWGDQSLDLFIRNAERAFEIRFKGQDARLSRVILTFEQPS